MSSSSNGSTGPSSSCASNASASGSTGGEPPDLSKVPEDGKIDTSQNGGKEEKKERKKNCFPWMHHAIVVRDKPGFGKGLVSTEFISEGTVVWRDSEDAMNALRYTNEELATWPKEEYDDWEIHAYQVDEWLFSGTRVRKGEEPIRDNSEYKNHSCDPNTWHVIDDDTVMTARRDIHPGDDVTYDYCTTETENSKHVAKGWKCICGAKVCRGRLTGVEYKDPELQKRYARRWAAYIQDKIDKENEKAEKEKAEKEKSGNESSSTGTTESTSTNSASS